MLPRDPASHSRHREHFEFLADQRQDFEQLAAAGAIDQLTVAEQPVTKSQTGTVVKPGL
jgi:hypothetical protein